eukprot:GDKJ01048656.1.p1 GENE.GDKJ01048656.1~~GDKJ01048656.1.p1  ORF type:complete len:537 (+),score=124.39 GDKJ01048656.1:312-1922(+)
MVAEWKNLVEYAQANIDGFIPPPEFKPGKRVVRLKIPLDKYPNYNFMGVIIGPRGATQKKIGNLTGCEISIRGKNSNMKGRKEVQTDEEAKMDQHVYIRGETDAQVDLAVRMVMPLLDPTSAQHDEIRREGQMLLANITGSHNSAVGGVLSEMKCPICSCPGHAAVDCPDAKSFQSGVAGGAMRFTGKCEICGDRGHVTMDCKRAKEFGISPASSFHDKESTQQPFIKGVLEQGAVAGDALYKLGLVGKESEEKKRLKIEEDFRNMIKAQTAGIHDILKTLTNDLLFTGLTGADSSTKNALDQTIIPPALLNESSAIPPAVKSALAVGFKLSEVEAFVVRWTGFFRSSRGMENVLEVERLLHGELLSAVKHKKDQILKQQTATTSSTSLTSLTIPTKSSNSQQAISNTASQPVGATPTSASSSVSGSQNLFGATIERLLISSSASNALPHHPLTFSSSDSLINLPSSVPLQIFKSQQQQQHMLHQQHTQQQPIRMSNTPALAQSHPYSTTTTALHHSTNPPSLWRPKNTKGFGGGY